MLQSLNLGLPWEHVRGVGIVGIVGGPPMGSGCQVKGSMSCLVQHSFLFPVPGTPAASLVFLTSLL